MSHILAVSGMHLSVLVGAVGGILSVLKKDKTESTALTVVLMVLTVAYMAVAGFGMSIRRAGFMLLIRYLAQLLRTESTAIDSLGAAIITVVLIDLHDALPISLWRAVMWAFLCLRQATQR